LKVGPKGLPVEVTQMDFDGKEINIEYSMGSAARSTSGSSRTTTANSPCRRPPRSSAGRARDRPLPVSALRVTASLTVAFVDRRAGVSRRNDEGDYETER
jgi:hypothetical protein